MIHSFQQKIPDNWHEHADRFNNVGNPAAPARRRDPRSQEIVQPKNVYYVEVAQSRVAKSCLPRVPAQRAVVYPVRQVNRLDSAFLEPPPPSRSFPPDVYHSRCSARLQTPIRG